MKKFTIVLSIIILLAMLPPYFSIIAQPTHIPHEDPAFAKDSLDPVSLLLFYSNVFDLVAERQYQDAESLLNDLEDVNIPDELQYIIDRYNTLTQELLTTLENQEFLLDEASTLLAEYQVGEAKQKLDDAEAAIHDAQFLLDDIETATNALSDRLGVSAAAAGSHIIQAHDRLQGSVHRPRQLTNELNQLQQSLTEKHKAQVRGELMSTELSLSITPASLFVGDSITASGRLTGDGNPLASRKLTLLLDNKPLVITTDLDGSYATNITIPYKYVSTMTLKAVYPASDDDIITYLGCASSPVVVNTSFYPTLLEVLAPETAHPGLPITISGQVSSSDGTIDRTVQVLLDNTRLAEEMTQGQFNIQITLPLQVSTGKHSLTVIATPQGRYSGASKSLTINIATQIPIQADIQNPRFVLVPKSIEVSGEVRYGQDPLSDAWVELTFKDSSTTVKTSTDGSFSATIDTSFDFSLIGPQELGITIEPSEPRYSPLQVTRRIITINLAIIGLVLVAFVSLGLLVFRRVRTRLSGQREQIAIPEAGLQEPLVVSPVSGASNALSATRGRVLSAYRDGIGIVMKVTGILIAPHTTLREFLNTAATQIPAALKPFTELTLTAENALYSDQELDESTATEAEQLVAIIKEELYCGTA